MESLIHAATETAVLLISGMALIAIVFGSLEAFVLGVRNAVQNRDQRIVLMMYGRWLIAGLTFLLAADILETMIKKDWDDVGRLAAIAVIRTFLSYFLERDLKEIKESTKE